MQKILCLLVALLFIAASACSFGIEGSDGLNVSGNESDSSITISLDGSVVRGVLADTGNATGSGHWLKIEGAGNVSTSASGNVVTISFTGGSVSSDMSLAEGHLFVGNSSGLAQDMELSGDATLNGLGELDVTWSDECQSADTANSSTDSDKLDGVHGSGYLLGNATAVDSDKVDGSHASAFLAVAGTAADSDKLDGQHGSYYGVAGSGVTGLVAGTGISVSGSTGNITITNTLPDTLLSSKVINFTRELSAGSGDVSYTGIGFTPTSIVANLVCRGSTTSIRYSGVVDSGKVGSGVGSYEGSVVVTQQSYLIYCSLTAYHIQVANVKSYDADGFTLTWTKTTVTNSATAYITAICYR